MFTRFGIFTQPALVVILPDGEVQTLYGATDAALLDSLISAALT